MINAEKIKLLKQDFDTVYQKGFDKGRETEKLVNKYYNLFVQDGLVYHLNFATAKSGATVKSDNTYAQYLIYTRGGIGNPISDGVGHEFGNGYLNLANGVEMYLYNDAVKAALKAATEAVSLETVIEGIPATEGAAAQAYFYIGPRYMITLNADNPYFALHEYGDMVLGTPHPSIEGNYWNIPKTDGTKVNTYSLVFDLTKIQSNKYDIIQYANGEHKGTRADINTATETTYYSAGSGLIQPISGGVNLYALRVYDKKLTLAESRQNHFADIAFTNRLDISEFNELTDDAEKAAVYKAFEDVPVNGENLQAKLDKALEDARIYTKYYKLYVKDGLLYHTNFKLATTKNGTVSNISAYAPFLVYMDELISDPWCGGAGATLGDGYLLHKVNGDAVNIYNGGVLELLQSASAVSVEHVFSFENNTNVWYYIGPNFKLSSGDASMGIEQKETGYMLGSESKYQKIFMTENFDKVNINTYAFTFDFIDIANKKYTLDVYGNGKNYSNQELVSETAGFSAAGTITQYNQGVFKTYAMRVYDRKLSENELLQNHFADVALINNLDISGFMEATPEKKAEVYEAFKTVSASDTGLQAKLDALLN